MEQMSLTYGDKKLKFGANNSLEAKLYLLQIFCFILEIRSSLEQNNMQLVYFKCILEQIKHIKKCGIGAIRISFIKYIACLISYN